MSVLLLTLSAACGSGPEPQAAEPAHLERMATEHRGDRGDVQGAAAAAAQPDAVWSGEVEYASIGGVAVRGFFARPRDRAQGAPGVIVIHEWWGLNDNIRAMARELAAEGYAALAVDLYRGRHTAEPDEARRLAGEAVAHRVETEDNLRQARNWLARESQSPRVGVIGWCFGGGWSLQTALLLPGEIDAAVIYYGRVETDPARLASLDAPLLGIFGALDRGIPVAQVRAFERQLAALDKPATIQIYEGANHAFANPSGTRYEPEAAADAWRRTVAFLAEHLGGNVP